MQTRKHVHEEEFAATPQRMFSLLHTPSAIRQWWNAAHAVVVAKEGGLWVVTWGASEDDPDYVGKARIAVFDPPRRMVLDDWYYHARVGPLPFEARIVTEFVVEPRPSGCVLRVTQDGFPAGPEADEFYAGCQRGWRDTFAGIRRYLAEQTG